MREIKPETDRLSAFHKHKTPQNLRKWSNMWSKTKNGLVQPLKQGRTSPLYLLRKRETSREFARKQKKIGGSIEPPILDKEEDIDIKIRSVSNWKFRFQSQKFCFKLDFFVSKRFLPLKSAKITVFLAPRGVMTNAAYIENGVGGISVFLLAAIIGGENIYRNVRTEPERIHEN